MGSATTVSVVIPVRNGASVIGGQLTALSRQNFTGSLEIVVADNRSSDDLSGAVRRFRDGLDLSVVEADRRLGVSHARNVGCRAARGQLLLICDADDEVAADWVDGHVRALENAELSGGPLELRALNPARVRRWRDVAEQGISTSMGYLPFPQGCNVGVTRALFEQVGGWNEELVGGGDDADFAWRVQLAGGRLAHAPAAVVHYRLRTSLRGTVRQTATYAAAKGALLELFGDRGMQPSSPPELGRRVAWLVTRFPYALMWWSWRQGRWLVKAAQLWGGLVASVRCRRNAF